MGYKLREKRGWWEVLYRCLQNKGSFFLSFQGPRRGRCWPLSLGKRPRPRPPRFQCWDEKTPRSRGAKRSVYFARVRGPFGANIDIGGAGGGCGGGTRTILPRAEQDRRTTQGARGERLFCKHRSPVPPCRSLSRVSGPLLPCRALSLSSCGPLPLLFPRARAPPPSSVPTEAPPRPFKGPAFVSWATTACTPLTGRERHSPQSGTRAAGAAARAAAPPTTGGSPSPRSGQDACRGPAIGPPRSRQQASWRLPGRVLLGSHRASWRLP